MKFEDQDILLVSGVRTPFGNFGGLLKDVSITDLTQLVMVKSIERAKLEPEDVQDVVTGNVIQSANNAAYFVRHAAIKSKIPIVVPAKITNRLCGSGMESIVEICRAIKLGEIDCGLAAGAEQMSQAPYVSRSQRWGSKMGHGELEDTLTSALTDQYTGTIMGVTAENLADKYKISRQQQDEFAVRSQELAAKARDNGRLAKEIEPVVIPSRKGDVTMTQDEFIKGADVASKINALKPVFKKDGSVTAGNASGINDGAASMILVNGKMARERNLTPLAKIVSWGHAGVEPSIMGIGPVYAMQNALQRAGLSINQMDLIEVNEAFAAQYLSVEKEMNLKQEIVNVNGGAIAIGHPLGASGTRVALTLAMELQERGKKYGIASLCIGGGQGIALVLQNANA